VPMAGPMTNVKKNLFERLVRTSQAPIVVGFDYEQQASDVQSIIDGVQHSSSQLVAMSHTDLQHRYAPGNSPAVNFFAGSPPNAPSKLAALDWFVRSNYSFMWHFEDDTYVHNFTKLASLYKGDADLVISAHYGQLPFWYPKWMVGSKIHGRPPGTFNMASLSAYRSSHRFAQSVLLTMRAERTASHHEIYFPYIISQNPTFQLRPLRTHHAAALHFNTDQLLNQRWAPFCELVKQRVVLAHPVKSYCCSGKRFDVRVRRAMSQRMMGSDLVARGQYRALARGCQGDDLFVRGAQDKSGNTSLSACMLACDTCYDSHRACMGFSFRTHQGNGICILKASTCSGGELLRPRAVQPKRSHSNRPFYQPLMFYQRIIESPDVSPEAVGLSTASTAQVYRTSIVSLTAR